mgnify:CR=1 FL=1
MQTSRRVARLGSGIFDRNDQRKQLYLRSEAAQRQPLVDLSLGSTDLEPPPQALAAMSSQLQIPGSATYCLHAGTRPLREAVASWCHSRFAVEVDPETEVLLLVGSQEGTAHLPLAVLNPGDAGLILDPSYPSHQGGLLLADAQIERLPLKESQNWQPHWDLLSRSQWDQLRLMVLGFPHNPTAQVGDQAWLDEAIARARSHDCVVAHDNPYLDLALDGEAPALLRTRGWRERGIEFFSLSKGWCLGGYRLAFAVGAEPLITALRQLKGVVDFNQSLALQQGAIVALTEVPDWPRQIVPIYRERRDRTLAALRCLGWCAPIPSMALYLWLPLPPWTHALGWNDEDLAAALLEQAGVALTPGSGFGAAGTNWLRLALVQPSDRLEQAIERMKPWWRQQC